MKRSILLLVIVYFNTSALLFAQTTAAGKMVSADINTSQKIIGTDFTQTQ